MKLRVARRVIEHRVPDVILCWRRGFWKRGRLAGLLLMEAATVIEERTRNDVEVALAIGLKSALLKKDKSALLEINGALTENYRSNKS